MVLSFHSAGAKNIGRLASVTSPAGYSEVYSYDSLGRLLQQTVTADGSTYNINLTYVSATGLLATLEYPLSTSNYRLKLGYDYASNLPKRVKDANGSTVFWEAVSTDAFGHVQDELFGNGVATFTDFDQASGLMSAREGGLGGGTGLINATVDWDLNGNLTQRRDFALSPTVTEDIVYDSLDRFDSSTRTGTGAVNQDVTLDAIGNILWKKDVCPDTTNCFTYHATKKRAVITAGSNSYGYDANGNMTSRNGSSIGYTSFNLPSSIAAGSNSSTLSYGAYRNRYKQVAVAAGVTETTIYVAGLLEKVTRGSVTAFRHLIPGSTGTAAVYTRRSDATTSTYYVQADHLGSPELITSSAGVALVRPSFGAYGERRDGSDWSGAPSTGDLTSIGNINRRGFTGHEHLDAVGLIHMNGRVYEPVIGRFLGVDPIVQLGSSQSPNSYAYVWNNPLTFTDPSGFDVDGGNAPLWIDGLAPGDTYHGWDISETREFGERRSAFGLDNGMVIYIGTLTSMQDVTSAATRGVRESRSTVGGASFADFLLHSPEHVAGTFGENSWSLAFWNVFVSGWAEAADDATHGEYGAAVLGVGTTLIKPVRSAGKIWSEAKGLSPVRNALEHWKKHRNEFPELQNAKQYAESARRFFSNPPAGTKTFTRSNGDRLFYDPGSNTFGVLRADGVPRTMFRPDDGIEYWLRAIGQ